MSEGIIEISAVGKLTALPYLLKGLNCLFGSTTSALPGTTPSLSSYITAMNRSVVGSGPIRIPGKSLLGGD